MDYWLDGVTSVHPNLGHKTSIGGETGCMKKFVILLTQRKLYFYLGGVLLLGSTFFGLVCKGAKTKIRLGTTELEF